MQSGCSNRQGGIESNTRANQRLQPAVFGAVMQDAFGQSSLWLSSEYCQSRQQPFSQHSPGFNA